MDLGRLIGLINRLPSSAVSLLYFFCLVKLLQCFGDIEWRVLTASICH